MMLRGTFASLLAISIVAGGAQASTRTHSDLSMRSSSASSTVVLVASDAPVASANPVYALPKLPGGYKYAFGEGRHNPNRGERSPAGRATMSQIWSNEVPQSLLDPSLKSYGLKVEGYR